MTLDQINTRLEELKNRKTQVKGLETEVYARIVGYYRAVRNWNKGKKEEYGKRLNYRDLASKADTVSPGPGRSIGERNKTQTELSFKPTQKANQYLYFFRKTCPNCPPVSEWLNRSGLEGRKVDVDRESGMHEAGLYGITAAPTVILLNRDGEEVGRGSTIRALNDLTDAAMVAGAQESRRS